MSYKQVKNPYKTYKGDLTRRYKNKFRRRKRTNKSRYLLETITEGDGILPIKQLEEVLGYPPGFKDVTKKLEAEKFMSFKKPNGGNEEFAFATARGRDFLIKLCECKPNFNVIAKKKFADAKIDIETWRPRRL